MGRIIKLVLAISVLYFVFQFGVSFFKDYHDLSYEMVSGDNTFLVKEEFNLEGDDNSYYFEIKLDDLVFNYYFNYNYNKQVKVLENIEYYNKDGLSCILPVFKDNITGEILCSKDNLYYTQDTVGNIDEFKSILINNGYDDSIFVKNNEAVEYERLFVYQDNIPDKSSVVVWNYKGIDILSNDEMKFVKVLKNDQYNNTLGSLLGNSYFIANFNSEHEYNSFYMINLDNYETETVFTNTKISFNSYVNGVVDNVLYLTDKDNRLQYSYDLNSKEFLEVGSASENAKFYSGEWTEIPIAEVAGINNYFTNGIEVTEELETYNIVKIYQSYENYYFITNDGSVYKMFRDYVNPVLIYKDAGVKDLIIYENDVYFLVGDTIYLYNASNGVVPIVKSNEFLYNNVNIFDVYKR